MPDPAIKLGVFRKTDMGIERNFQEITILIPGYSIEDLPTDLNEKSASSLLNAFAVAWHPLLLIRSTGVPQCRQADSTQLPTGQQILLVPECSEDWLGHDWEQQLADTQSVVFSGCADRSDWLSAIRDQFGDESAVPEELARDFFALGTCHLQVMLLSRRMHHFVDPDQYVLESEALAAAAAAVANDVSLARDHLRRCFECLLNCREQFHPTDCYLLDLCLPSDQSTAEELSDLIATSQNLTLVCSGSELQRFAESSPRFQTELLDGLQHGRLAVMAGQQDELRTSLGSLSGLYSDLSGVCIWLRSMLQEQPIHWARRRFGMTASLPSCLSLFHFKSALHVALDDGLYPDREYGQLLWQAPDGTTIPAVSRIPIAIDGAASFLRFADRYTESLHEDTTGVMLLARLPVVQTPWLEDLRIAAGYAPVLGQFATMTEFIDRTMGEASPTSYDEGEYLSPYLIQSSVLKTEAPISSPAALHRHRARLESIAALDCICATLGSRADHAGIIEEAERRLNAEEAARLSLDAPENPQVQAERLASAAESLETLENAVTGQFAELIPAVPTGVRGLCLLNPLPWKRMVTLPWPVDYRPPANIEAVHEAQNQNDTLNLTVTLPAGGFAWLTEAAPDRQPVRMTPDRGKPLAEDLLLRNRCFEVLLSETTGGIASVTFHNQRANRISQQLAFRYENSRTLMLDGEEVVTSYATGQLISSRVVASGPTFGAVETTGQILDGVSGQIMAEYRQTFRVERNSSRLEIRTEFDSVTELPRGNPWMTYYCCRFAWENEAAAITRGMLGQARGFRMERFESPDYVEIADADTRVVIVPHGRPYHRRSGRRMLDSLLMVEGENARSFEFTLDFDQPYPTRVAAEVLQPALTTMTSGRSPSEMPSAWILGLSARNVVAARMRVEPRTDEEVAGKTTRIVLLLEETEGRSASCQIRTARKPASARVRRADGETIQNLTVSEQGVPVDFSRFQIKEVELTF